ncbi:Hypothetical predicted protein [Octopus vulgaris]|uniref:Uncharacterized protein n=1 Tax=Octopus vulgaris TaxID=6645 RepID=A0AA36B8K9_OCTVU|nr:Hypothetical predicted protein [Octopus vulgaris]
MDYEEVIGTIGGCGLYQRLMLAFLFSSTIMDGLQVGSMVFIAPDLDYRCAIPGYDNDTYKIQSEIHEELINEYIPKSEDEGEVVYEKCLIYFNSTENGNRTTQKCSSWVYDKTNTHTSITSQLNLVCDKAILARNRQHFLIEREKRRNLENVYHSSASKTDPNFDTKLGDCELGIFWPFS